MRDAKQADAEKMNASLVSYALAQDIPEEHFEELQKHLRSRGIESELEEIRDKINSIIGERERIKKEREQIARLFSPQKKIRVYRYGSTFCPQCHMFKNYEKECPYCRYLEMTE